MIEPRMSLCCALGVLSASTMVVAEPRPVGPAVVFKDISASAGIELTGVLTESVCWGDYDNDDDPDLYLTNKDVANSLFRNDGGGTFTDVTTVAGVGSAAHGVGCAFGDLDNDGDLDLFVVNFGGSVLYRNDGPVGPGGAYEFTNVTASAQITLGGSRGMAYVDYDRDGLLDIYVNAIGDDILWHNLGNFQFQDVAASVGVTDNAGNGVGVTATDVDNDGWVDLFTGNNTGDVNRLYMNNNGVYTDVALDAGITEIGPGMGVLSLDYDNDLDFDLYWTSWPGAPNALYENVNGDATSFANVAVASGTSDPAGFGISCNAGDVDNDGWEDFFVTNGWSVASSANVLFRNEQNGTFSDATAALGGGVFDGRGVAFADFDSDGDLDLCVTAAFGQPNKLWENVTNNGNHWVTFRLIGTDSNRTAIGARVEVTTDLRTVVKEVSGGAGRGSANDPPLEFGLGTATTIQLVRIRWPSGLVTFHGNLPMDRIYTITEGKPGQPCDDWQLCNVGETYDAGGVCVGGLPMDCAPFDTECASFLCDPVGLSGEGNCDDRTDIPDGTTCAGGLGECLSGECSSCYVPAAVSNIASRYIQVIPDVTDPGRPVALRIENRCTLEVGWVALTDVDYLDDSACNLGTPNAGGGCDPDNVNPCGIGTVSRDCTVSRLNVGVTAAACDNAEFHTRAEWLGIGGKLVVTGGMISPQTKFDVVAVCGDCGSPNFSDPPATTSACTWSFCDATNDGQVTFAADLFKIFSNTGSAGFPFFTGPDPGYEVDTQGNDPSVPDGQVTFVADLFSAFKATDAGGGDEWTAPICIAECPDP